MRKIVYIAGLIMAFAIGMNCRKERYVQTQSVSDTVVVHDTLIVRQPPVTAQAPLPSRKVTVPADSVDMHPQGDSASVTLPAVSRKYAGEGYEAYVSGIEPRLDSLRLFTTSSLITTRIAAPARCSRWSIGVSAGYAATPRGLQPYIGIGVSYRILSF